jgi:histone deacetylase 6
VIGSLRPVKSDIDSTLSKWYKENSLIYVSADHSCWNDEENAKRVRKSRFGQVKKSEVIGLGRMMKKYQGQASGWLMKQIEAWEANHNDDDETEDEAMVERGSRTLGGERLGLGVNGGPAVVAGV